MVCPTVTTYTQRVSAPPPPYWDPHYLTLTPIDNKPPVAPPSTPIHALTHQPPNPGGRWELAATLWRRAMGVSTGESPV